MINEHHFHFVTSASIGKHRRLSHGIIDSTYRENGKNCKFTLAKEPAQSFFPIVHMLQKNSPFTKAINEQLRYLFTITQFMFFWVEIHVFFHTEFNTYSTRALLTKSFENTW